MKRLITAIAILLLTLTGGSLLAQDASQVEAIFSAKNLPKLADAMAPTVEVRILDEGNTYAKAQAAVVVQTFFKSSPIEKVEVSHTSERGESSFFICKLSSKTESFRMTIFLQGNTGSRKISQLQITRGGGI